MEAEMELLNREESGALSTFMIRAVIGAGIVLLFSPKAGVQMRRRLRDSLAQAKDEVDKILDHGTEMVDSAVEHGQGFAQKSKDALRETGRQVKHAAAVGEKAFKETKDEFSSQHH
jgi:gas vesicle protein